MYLLVLFVLPAVLASQLPISVNSSHQLKEILCDDTKILSGNLDLVLDSDITHQRQVLCNQYKLVLSHN